MRKTMLFAGILIGLLTCGCASVYDLTTEESDLIAEYAAGVMSKVSNDNRNDYYKLKTHLYVPEVSTTNKPVVKETEATSNPDANVEVIDPKVEDPTAAQNATVSNIAQVLGMQDVEITCLGYDVVDSYPKDEFALSTSATAGHKLVVVQYNLMNLTSKDVVMHIEAGVGVKAVINGSESVKVSGTLLNDDIMNMDGKVITPGETKQGVFIFNVKEELCGNIASLNVVANKK